LQTGWRKTYEDEDGGNEEEGRGILHNGRSVSARMIQKRKGTESNLLVLFFLHGNVNVVLTPGKGFGTRGQHGWIQQILQISALRTEHNLAEPSDSQLLLYCKVSVLKAKGKDAATLVDGEEGYTTFQELLEAMWGLDHVE
jgi:hypothetical protein